MKACLYELGWCLVLSAGRRFWFFYVKPGLEPMLFLEKTRKWDWFWGEPLGLWEKLLLFLNFGKNTREDVSEDETFLGNLYR